MQFTALPLAELPASSGSGRIPPSRICSTEMPQKTQILTRSGFCFHEQLNPVGAHTCSNCGKGHYLGTKNNHTARFGSLERNKLGTRLTELLGPIPPVNCRCPFVPDSPCFVSTSGERFLYRSVLLPPATTGYKGGWPGEQCQNSGSQQCGEE